MTPITALITDLHPLKRNHLARRLWKLDPSHNESQVVKILEAFCNGDEGADSTLIHRFELRRYDARRCFAEATQAQRCEALSQLLTTLGISDPIERADVLEAFDLVAYNGQAELMAVCRQLAEVVGERAYTVEAAAALGDAISQGTLTWGTAVGDQPRPLVRGRQPAPAD